MLRTILLIIAIIVLIINIFFTVREAAYYYKLTMSSTDSGRIRGESGAHEPGPDGRIRIAGMWYNVKWIIRGKEGIIYYEEKDTK